ncbi:hypothetical protein N825_28180 [Skermanella stibiiresistens SB22]|uniref:histidine kinase n=1 Tax=Skermanella stibiiresistens SB22 TaxID=1385369 RepID=W9H9Y2_9PROT|nr:sensor histidine kinase [Skermanella stibiiresistens]EWY41522.1 hypothetical protein N825_28180 [Skermanella stibiiresistens SB22]
MTADLNSFALAAEHLGTDQSVKLARSLTRRLRFVAVLSVVFIAGLTAVFLLLFHEVGVREHAIRTTYAMRVALDDLRDAFGEAGVSGTVRNIAAVRRALARVLDLSAQDVPQDAGDASELTALIRLVETKFEVPGRFTDDAGADVTRRIDALQAEREAQLRERVAWVGWLSACALYGGAALGLAKVVIIGTLLGQSAVMARREERMLEERTSLLRELNHRVANSLATAVAMLQLQASQITDRSLRRSFEEARNRIVALGEVHRRLLSSDAVSTLDLSTLLPGLGQDLARALGAGDRVSITATPVVASVDLAAAMAIIMTELMTNAVRHGCDGAGSDEAACHVTVDLRAAPGGGLDLSVRDTGGQLPAGFSPERSGKAGLRIVGALVDQLGGSLSYRHDGFTEAFVRIPAE